MTLDWINRGVLAVLDVALGWMLFLPRDLVLLLLAAGTAVVMVRVRKRFSDQETLRRCAADKRQLRARLRAARQAKDRAGLARIRALRGRVVWRQFVAEWRPLLISLLPLAAVGLWGWQRLEFHPPRVGHEVTVEAWFPLSMNGRVAHLVPEDGLTAVGGWVRELRPEPQPQPQRALARWVIRGGERAQPYTLRVRQGDRAYAQPLTLGQRRYDPPVVLHDGRLVRVAVGLEPVRLLGLVPGIPWVRVPAWMVGYLVLVLPLVTGLKRGWGVH